MKKQLFSILFMILLLATTGCAQEGQQLPASVETVSNMFTRPSEEPIQNADDAVGFQPYSFFSHSFEQDALTYEGGELRVSFRCTGEIGSSIGYVLILDGQPQPYKLSEDGEYSYMHTITMRKEFAAFEFIFQPITGSIGETLELCAININDPEHRISVDGIAGYKHTQGSIPVVATIDFLAEPSAADFPDVSNSIANISAEYIDVAEKDMAGWNDEDLRSRSEYIISVNGSNSSSTFWGVSTTEPIQIHLEIWGNPNARFGVIFFLNGEPVLPQESNLLLVDNEQGKKTVIDVQLDPVERADESVLYVMIVCRNIYEIYDDGIQWFADAMTYYLIPQEKP